MKYKNKKCKKCGVQFKTRPFYNKDHCRKCWNAIRMRKAYRRLHPNKRIIFVSGNQAESKHQWIIRNKEKNLICKNNSNHKRRVQSRDTDITTEWLMNLKRRSKTCAVCKIRMVKDGRKLGGKTTDHKIPLNRGGKHIKKNIWIICRRCNIKKGQKIVEVIGSKRIGKKVCFGDC